MMADTGPIEKKTADLKLRLISAAILGPLVLAVTYWGGTAYALLILVAATLFLWEWRTITGCREALAGTLISLISLVVLALLGSLGRPGAGLAVLLLGALLTLALGRFGRVGRWGAEGLLYSGFALFGLLAARNGSNGLIFTFFLLFVVWATDIFAYFTGRALGGPKLWQSVSPKKTWSGALGGLLCAVLFGTGLVMLLGGTALLAWAGLAVVLSVVSQAGDLLESAIKRRFDVKDSSRLIPGHGGIMDRIDGLVAAAIFAVFLGLAAGGSLADPIAGLGLR